MTVAAVVLVPNPLAALADADGEPVIRRLVQAAWSGGALSIVLVAAEGANGAAELDEAIAALPARLVHPAADLPQGAAWFAHGAGVAAAAVAETSAALLWPFRYGWVDPETVTSLVEAHGVEPTAIVRPSFRGEPGFPVLVPLGLTERFAADPARHAPEVLAELVAAGVALRDVELGDPGIVLDVSTPRSELPPYQGPPEPAGGPPPEWNAAIAAGAGPAVVDAASAAGSLEGPALAPYGQAASPDSNSDRDLDFDRNPAPDPDDPT